MRDMADLACHCIHEYCIWSGSFSEYMIHKLTCEFLQSDSDEASLSHSDTSDNGDSDTEIEVCHTDISRPPVLSRGLLGQNAFEFLFPIRNFKEKFNRAKQGVTRAIYSDVHTTGDPGYSVGACVYLHGDGMAKGRFMSLFFYLAKGTHDDTMHWPFNRKVALILSNQCEKEDLKQIFQPDPTSSSFQRVTAGDKNTPSGFPLFCPVDKLVDPNCGFVKHDQLLIKVLVSQQDTCLAAENWTFLANE